MSDTLHALPNYFDGMELGADDFAAEQGAFDAARTLYNRTLHTWGIASGLEVTIDEGKRAVTVAPGLAIDPNGREIALAEPRTVAAPPLRGQSRCDRHGANLHHLS